MCLSSLRGSADLELGVSPGGAGGGDHHVLLLHLLPGAVHHVLVTIARLHDSVPGPALSVSDRRWLRTWQLKIVACLARVGSG